MATYHRTWYTVSLLPFSLNYFLVSLLISLIHELFKTTLVNMPILGNFQNIFLLWCNLFYSICIFNIFKCIETFLQPIIRSILVYGLLAILYIYSTAEDNFLVRVCFCLVSSSFVSFFGGWWACFNFFSELILIICRRVQMYCLYQNCA